MSLETNLSRNIYTGNGVTTSFPFTFRIWETDQILVYVSTGDESEDDVTASCTIEIPDEDVGTGTVTFATPPADGVTIALVRNMPFIQEDRYINGTRFDPHEVEDRFDQDCAERQQLLDGIGMAVKVTNTSSETPEQLRDRLLYYGKKSETVADNIGSVNTVSDNIDAVNTVAEGIEPVKTVASNIGDVRVVADSVTDINVVASDLEGTLCTEGDDYGLVSEPITSYCTTGGNIYEVAQDLANIDKVADNLTALLNLAAVTIIANNIDTIREVAAYLEGPTYDMGLVSDPVEA